jgi:anti-sigma regulatory factor (Ser/Thr protein kinase)
VRDAQKIALDEDASTHARERLTAALEGSIAPGRLTDVLLATSELVSNAVRHSGAEDHDSLLLRVDLDQRCVRVEVEDPGPGFDPGEVADRSRAAASGFGLRLVSALADRWGVDSRRPTRVWFAMDL